jgi:hypothetical protein
MKKLSILMLGLAFIMMASPVFPASLQFDIYPAGGSGDGVWDEDYAVNPGDEIQVDVWLDEYWGLPITSLIYSFKWDNTHLEVIDSWAFDTDHGGVWNHSYSYSHFLSGEDYVYRASSGIWIEPGIPVTNKIKLHTIVLENVTESTSKINTEGPGFGGVMVEGGFSFSVSHAEAEIHPPAECDITVEPETKIVSSGEAVQFTADVTGDYCDDPCYTWEIVERESTGSIIDANGMYTAGSTGGTDKVKATDTCSGNESISAIAIVTVVPCKVTLDPEGKTVLINKTLQFSATSSGDCNPSCYAWEIMERESAGSTIDVNGMYTAGSAVGTDKVKVTDTCNGGISSETTVEVIPCKLTIDPPRATVPPGQVQEFTASLEGNCNEPCYTWSVSSEGTTENTTNNSASIYTWSMNAGGATGDTGNTTNTYSYQAGPSEGKATVTVTDKCNNDLSETAEVTIKASSTTTTITINPPPIECYSDDDCANDDLFCNGEVNCRRGICRSTSDPCQDDGLFCNGEESCDEENDECLPGGDPCSQGLCDEDNDVCVVEPLPECETDAECNDGLFCNGEETCNENGTCQSGNDPCADDGLFCTGVESCDEDSDVCISSGDPCTSPEVCDDNADVCAPPPAPPLLLDIIPNQALRSHLIPLPLFMFLTTSDEDTSFDLLATTVSSSSDAITPIWTFVLTEDLIFGFAFTTPAGLETTGSTNVEIAVTVNDRVGTATLILNMLPWILDDGRNPM